MKTTIEISDDLFVRAQRLARKEKTTFRALTEAGLRMVISGRQSLHRKRLPPLVTSGGDGLTDEFKDGNWDQAPRGDLQGPRHMIALDTNVLVYSHRLESPFHEAAKELVESFRSNPSPWAIPWPCVHEFLSIVTHPKVYKTPATLAEAFASVDAWLAGGNLQLLGESDGYFEKLRAIAKAAQLKGPRIHDARVAALCLHHGVRELWTADRDFSIFPQLKTRNPFVKT